MSDSPFNSEETKEQIKEDTKMINTDSQISSDTDDWKNAWNNIKMT